MLGPDAVFFKGARWERAILFEFSENRAAEFVVVANPLARAVRPCRSRGDESRRFRWIGVETLMIGLEIIAHKRVVYRKIFREYDGGAVRPVFEKLTVAPEKRVEMFQIVWTDAAKEDELMAARDDVDRVDLQTAEVANDVKNALWAGIRLCARQALARDCKTASEGGGEMDRQSYLAPSACTFCAIRRAQGVSEASHSAPLGANQREVI